MKGGDRQVMRRGPKHACHALAQGRRRGRGERDGQDGRRRDTPLLDQIRDPTREHRGLAAPWPGQHAEWAIPGLDDVTLARGKVAEVQTCASAVATPPGPFRPWSVPAT